MSAQRTLDFFHSILNQLHLPFLIAPTSTTVSPQVDMGLRGALGLAEPSLEEWGGRFRGAVKENAIYYITDEFSCRYAVLLHPTLTPQSALIIGPYVLTDIDQHWVRDFVERNGLDHGWIPVLENHYRRVRYLEDEHLLTAALHALGEQLWGVGGFTTERMVKGLPESWTPLTSAPDPQLRDTTLGDIALLEQRYQGENRLMEAVSHGRTQQAQLMLSRFSRGAMVRRTGDNRDVKNYSIILNTLMRKAVERGGVHPLYIDRVSSDFAGRIEHTAQWEDFMALWSKMAHDYCLLVKKHTVSQYSPLVQKVLTRIDLDLAADLSLRATAAELNVNPSYLSTHFKAQTGTTITDYVNRKRVEHAAYLLSTTQLPISSVAASCGISDDNYFTKLFRRYNGSTPKQFRAEQKGFR